MTIIITGGSGFIGCNFIENFLSKKNENVINIDCLTYAGNIQNTIHLEKNKNYRFINININNEKELKNIFDIHQPRAVINFAAESHVDNSIKGPRIFIDTNILGTYNLLQSSLDYWRKLDQSKKDNFRYIQISTDEVYGSLSINDQPAIEESSYKPNSPYSASKAASDHLVRAWNSTYGLPTIISNCTNNYGPYQHLEKFLPVIIFNAINQNKIPIYGDGSQIRDWLYVKDHCNAIMTLLEKGKIGNTYNIGSNNEIKNIEFVKSVCAILDKIVPKKNLMYFSLVEHVEDRLGHDTRYSLNSEKMRNLGWNVECDFNTSLEETIKWYLKNNEWMDSIQKKS